MLLLVGFGVALIATGGWLLVHGPTSVGIGGALWGMSMFGLGASSVMLANREPRP